MDGDPSGTKPTVYILHGDNLHEMQSFVRDIEKRLRKETSDDSLIEMNVSHFDGQQSNLDEIRTTALALPFFISRRLVVVRHPLAKVNTKKPADQSNFLQMLDSLPESTALVLLIEDVFERGKWTIKEEHWLIRWAQQAGPRAFERLYALPSPENMPGWIAKEVRQRGGQFTPGAARLLAEQIGNDTLLASHEIEKLLTFVNFARPVEEEDVQQLTAFTAQVSVFDMVDAMANKQSSRALDRLQLLLEEQEPFILFGMIVRQYRLLLQAREIINEGGGAPQIAKTLGLHPFVAGKLVPQAQRFGLSELEEIHHRLLAVDESIKTSQTTPELALEMFVAGAY